jgi:hypothetical protein
MADAREMYERQVSISRPMRTALGAVVGLGAAFFAAVGVMLLTTDRSQMPSPNGALAAGYFLLVLAAGFGYVCFRLVRMKTSTERLFSPAFNRVAILLVGPCILTLGVIAAALGLLFGPAEIAPLGIFLVSVGVWLCWPRKRRKGLEVLTGRGDK